MIIEDAQLNVDTIQLPVHYINTRFLFAYIFLTKGNGQLKITVGSAVASLWAFMGNHWSWSGWKYFGLNILYYMVRVETWITRFKMKVNLKIYWDIYKLFINKIFNNLSSYYEFVLY